MFRFQNINSLWLMFIPVFIVGLFILAEIIRRRQLKKIGNVKLLNFLIPLASLRHKVWKMILIFLAFTSMIITLARPQFGSKVMDISTKGVEIMMAIDVSNSMLAQDIKPNRLENAKKFVEKVIHKLNNNKLGLIVFAGDAFIQMPLTDDVRAARMYLQGISTNSVNIQGTAIAAALELASKSFSSNDELQKIIILITDGENHEDNVLETVNNLKTTGIKVFCVGMGNPKGSPITLKNGKGFLKDRDGNVVMSALDEASLIKIANVTNGYYVRANNSAAPSDQIIAEIDKIDKGEINKQQYSEYDDRFVYFAVFALILLILDCFIPEKKSERFANTKFFDPLQ